MGVLLQGKDQQAHKGLQALHLLAVVLPPLEDPRVQVVDSLILRNW